MRFNGYELAALVQTVSVKAILRRPTAKLTSCTKTVEVPIFFPSLFLYRKLKPAKSQQRCPLFIRYARLENIQGRCKTILIVTRGKKEPLYGHPRLGINTFHDVLTTIVFMPHASGGVTINLHNNNKKYENYS